ncbi:MAG: YbhB/YbcL family Raf kinase inhibitor-like protein [Candidatus Lustribacter sp.]
MALKVSSSQFTDGGTLPDSAIYNGFGLTGANQSPDLSWSAGPAGTKSYVITCFDPDAPTTVGFWHWLLMDVPATRTSLPAGAGAMDKALPGTVLGYTDFGSSGFGGAAPPPGAPPHRYEFNVYALDVEKLGLGPGTTGAMLMFCMTGHILDQGRITALFAR